MGDVTEGASEKPLLPSEDVGGLYDRIADDYHLASESQDRRQMVAAQGRSLDSIIRARLGTTRRLSILDCTCGIGTQAIGLALTGHSVIGTDLSARAVERAGREAAALGVRLPVAVADMRRLDSEVDGQFDVVLSCDNSLAHLAGTDLSTALEAIKAKLAPSGLALVSIRDYDALAAECPRVPDPPHVHDTAAGRRIVLQVWDWEADGSAYSMTWLFLREGPDGFATSHLTTRLHAHRRADLTHAFEAAGFVEPRWNMPDQHGFYQPVLTALRP